FLIVFTGSSTPGLEKITKYLPKVDRSKWKNCNVFQKCSMDWVYTDIEVLYWDQDEFGDTMKYHFYEHDDGDPYTISSSITTDFGDGVKHTNTISATITKKDYPLGESFVRRCESAVSSNFKIYETSRFYFGVWLDY